jgi:hypothetical protein
MVRLDVIAERAASIGVAAVEPAIEDGAPFIALPLAGLLGMAGPEWFAKRKTSTGCARCPRAARPGPGARQSHERGDDVLRQDRGGRASRVARAVFAEAGASAYLAEAGHQQAGIDQRRPAPG